MSAAVRIPLLNFMPNGAARDHVDPSGATPAEKFLVIFKA